jgi:hypothetical protein
MRERVTDLGGRFAIECNSHGTAVVVRITVCGRDPVYAPNNDFLGTINNPITILVYV